MVEGTLRESNLRSDLLHSHVVRTGIGRGLVGAVLAIAEVVVYLGEQYDLATFQAPELFGHLDILFGPFLTDAGHIYRHLI